MSQNLNQFTERVPYIESSDAPWLVRRSVFDMDPLPEMSIQSFGYRTDNGYEYI